MPVADIVIDEIVASVRAVDSASLLDPRLVRRLVQAVLTGADDRRAREQQRQADSRIGEHEKESPQ